MDKKILINYMKNFLFSQFNSNNFSLDANIKNSLNELAEKILDDITKNNNSIENSDFHSFISNISKDKLNNNAFFKDNTFNHIPNFEKSRYNLSDFLNLTPYNGFDKENPQNARQNNYAWAFAELNDYIYVGTGRNLIYAALSVAMENIKVPIDYTPSKPDMGAEIWRYKKDGSLPWQKVYKSPVNPSTNLADIIGIRSLIKFNPTGVKPALYAGAYSMSGVKILKSINGVDWFDIPTGITIGTSSRSMMVYKNKLYLSVMTDGQDIPTLLYSSKDPELYGWTLETPQDGDNEENNCNNIIDGKNPKGIIWSMASFNNHIYLGTASDDGFMIWRTNSDTPKVNDWKLVIDKGAGDASNAIAISLVEFKENLYVGTAYNTFSFLSYFIPKGAEIIRIDKNDNWKIIVGGPVLKPSTPSSGKRNHPLSGFSNGFFNPFNLYMWQMKVYNNKLFIGTYDSSVGVERTYELLIKNKELFSEMMDENLLEIIISFIKLQILILSKIKKQFGFDFYVTDDGINYKRIDTTGFNNSDNYGIRNIFISDDNKMYIGTANPFSGCQVYQLIENRKTDNSSCSNSSSHNLCENTNLNDYCLSKSMYSIDSSSSQISDLSSDNFQFKDASSNQDHIYNFQKSSDSKSSYSHFSDFYNDNSHCHHIEDSKACINNKCTRDYTSNNYKTQKKCHGKNCGFNSCIDRKKTSDWFLPESE